MTKALSNTKAVLSKAVSAPQNTKLLKTQNPVTLTGLCTATGWPSGLRTHPSVLLLTSPQSKPLSPHSCFHNLAHYRRISMLHEKPAFYIMPPHSFCTTWKTGMLRGTGTCPAHTSLPLLLDVRTALLYCDRGSILSQWRAKQPGVLGHL